MKGVLSVIICFVLLASCLKKQEFPNEPQITLKSLQIVADTAFLVLGFTDGDGNFGLRQSDTTGVFAQCINKTNLYCEYYELQNGNWQHIIIDACDEPNDSDVPYHYRIPFAEPSGQNKVQMGEIEVKIANWYLPSEQDTVRFQIQIADQSLNRSNVVVTQSLVKPS